jgi:hypothetical protein
MMMQTSGWCLDMTVNVCWLLMSLFYYGHAFCSHFTKFCVLYNIQMLFLKQSLNFLSFQLITSQWPSQLSLTNNYLTCSRSLMITLRKRDFPSQKEKRKWKEIPQRKKKLALVQERRELAARGHISKLKDTWEAQAVVHS